MVGLLVPKKNSKATFLDLYLKYQWVVATFLAVMITSSERKYNVCCDPMKPPPPMIESYLYSNVSDYEVREYFNCMMSSGHISSSLRIFVLVLRLIP